MDTKINSSGTRRQQQKAETNALILSSARVQFEREGFKGATLRSIAARAGVGLGTICAHFPDKESLLMAVLGEDLQQIQQRFNASLPKDSPVMEQVLHMARAGYTFWGRRPELSRVLLKEMWFLQGAWADRMRALERETQDGLVALLRAAQQRSELHPDADPQLAARVGFAFYLTTILGALDRPDDSFDIDAMIEDTRRFLHQLFDGIGARR